MNELSNDVNYKEMKAELQALRKELEDLKADLKVSTHPTVRRRFAKRLIMASISFAVLLVAGGLLWGQGIQALFIDPKGNVGIGTTNPGFPLTFANTVGDKISLYGQSGDHYGFGIQDSLLQIYTYDPNTDIAFGYGSSASFKETVRIKGNGNVGIGRSNPNAKLDVNGNALVGGDLTLTGKLVSTGAIEAGNSDLYFTKTDHNHSFGNTEGYAAIENSKNYNALMILGRAIYTAANPNANPPVKYALSNRVVGMWDRVGIGKGDPQVPLDVAGEIRGTLINGKPKWLGEYEWRQNPWEGKDTAKNHPTPMKPTDSSVCFLTAVSGLFYGAGEGVEIIQQDGVWKLNGESQQKHVRAKAMCIGFAP